MAILDNQSIRTVHCMGIGGIGVSGIAEILLQKGYRVSGSDISKSATIVRLQKLGASISQGHTPDNIKQADLVVYSSAITQDNPEFQAAKMAGIPMIPRGQLLAELMKGYHGIAVSGTHGKTTTTGLLAQIFISAGMDPTYLIGGRIQDQDSTVRMGESHYFIAEADESDASFLYMSPKVIIVTNIEPDHLENYDGDFHRLKQSFLDFIQKLPEDGVAILGIDSPVVRELLPSISRRILTFGFGQDADIQARDFKQIGLKSHFIVERPDDLSPLSITLNMPGQHNVLNALAAIGVAHESQIPDASLLNTLSEFPGLGRRFHAHGELTVKGGKALLFDDYGHHPSAIKATLTTARQVWPDRRIVLVFQPHRYSRTRDLLSDFAKTLSGSDVLVLLEVFPAGEQPLADCNGRILCDTIIQRGDITPIFVPELEQLPAVLEDVLQPNDIVLLQGAGSIGSMAKTLTESY